MVEIIDTAVTSPALMTQFYITPETLDEDQLARAKEAYGIFVPQYTYAGHMGLAPKHSEELFVWRIVSPAGRPIAADCYRLGLRVNQDKYVGILKQFVDFVCEPLYVWWLYVWWLYVWWLYVWWLYVWWLYVWWLYAWWLYVSWLYAGWLYVWWLYFYWLLIWWLFSGYMAPG
ncbi:hypothetical protein F5883DRAFT_179959 [Diaporthe sp. PMI_573]|nr:hypothetical protein F5883DRAFT_179959 [Diaporthaceae sp. PMI_573]